MGYPLVLVNPQKPHAQFTEEAGGTAGRYTTPTGETIFFDTLRTYILSGFSALPSTADVRAAQRALGIPETGELDADTMAGVVNVQNMYGLLPTGVPDAATLAKIARVISGAPGGGDKRKRKDNSGEIVTLAVLALAVKFLFFRGE